VTKYIDAIIAWIKRNWDATLVLAIATETPRWTVVFITLHEPAWIGVTMGVLISWAAKKGWNAWTHDRTRHGLFALNAWVLISAVAIMTPVLLDMTQHKIEDVDVVRTLQALHMYAPIVWSFLVAQSTFMPLIQVVFALHSPHATVEVAHIEANNLQIATLQPIAEALQPVAEDMQSPQDASENAQSALQEIAHDAKALYLQLRRDGIAHLEAVRRSGATNANTALSWWRRANAKPAMQGGD
jgi:uncharacterized membrane protein (DUF441 family)